MENKNLACMINGHKPGGRIYKNRTTCVWCANPLYYVLRGNVTWAEDTVWKTREEIEPNDYTT